MLGHVAEIGQIEIVNDVLHVVSRNGESRTIATGILNWDRDLQKIARFLRKKKSRLSSVSRTPYVKLQSHQKPKVRMLFDS